MNAWYFKNGTLMGDTGTLWLHSPVSTEMSSHWFPPQQIQVPIVYPQTLQCFPIPSTTQVSINHAKFCLQCKKSLLFQKIHGKETLEVYSTSVAWHSNRCGAVFQSFSTTIFLQQDSLVVFSFLPCFCTFYRSIPTVLLLGKISLH